MDYNEVVNLLHAGLKSIVKSELSLGNKISEVSTAWGGQEALLIVMAFPFKKTYTETGVIYHELNDPHYWKAEYRYDISKQILACRF